MYVSWLRKIASLVCLIVIPKNRLASPKSDILYFYLRRRFTSSGSAEEFTTKKGERLQGIGGVSKMQPDVA